MTVQIASIPGHTSLKAAANFRSWQRDTFDRGLLPVVGIAGGRGKSTVARMLDRILQHAHLRTATWTDLGVEIRGKRQRGEISGWSLALSRLAEMSIDVAIQELDWSTINAVGLPASSYPLMGITNLMGSLDAPHGDGAATAIRRAGHRVATAVVAEGILVVSGDDPALVEVARAATSRLAITSLARESPNLRRHLADGGSGAWIEEDTVHVGDRGHDVALFATERLPSTLGGTAAFEVANALTAAALASSLGVDTDTITSGLCAFEPTPDILPGSFNVFAHDGCRIVIDNSAPSWHLRSILRSVNPGGRRRQITVLGDLERLPANDIHEIGRLLGRHAGAIILHSNKSPWLLDTLRKGISANRYPPLVIHLPTERRALNRALKTARGEDVVLILTDADSGPAIRAVQRQFLQTGPAATSES